MRASRTKLGAAWIVPLTACLLTGCALVPGGRGLVSPEANRLMKSTRELRQPVPPPLPRELDKQALPRYTVEPGDVLLVQPADLDSPVRLPGDQPVLPDGTINLGRYGFVEVAGRTIEEIVVLVQAAIRAQVKDAGIMTVRVVQRQSKVYYVLGDVNAPGAFPLAGRETVLDGILAAGGLTERASAQNIILSRPTAPNDCRMVLPVCYPEIVQHGDTTTNYQLAPGDRIFVPSRCSWDDMFYGKKNCPCGKPQTRCPLPGADRCSGEESGK